mmetsp:Transcript_34276/g.83148  ORF Transcript_34276/g.83148 Transcript_34276/m.83148 type:complete len:100 (+) Transcript_34276:99-398(+)
MKTKKLIVGHHQRDSTIQMCRQLRMLLQHQVEEAPTTNKHQQALPPGVKRLVTTSLSCSQPENSAGGAGQGVTLGNCIAILHEKNLLLVDQMLKASTQR